MRSVERLLRPAVLAALLLAGAAVAQAPGPFPQSPRRLVRGDSLGVDDVVARVLAFDKNNDGKITRDELPERMQFLIERGDTNKDGALDKAEIKMLATTRAAAPGGPGGGRAISVDRADIRGRSEASGVRTGFGPGTADIEGVVDDLKLAGKKKDQAMAAVKAHQENVRKLMDQARAELLQKMKEILSEEEWQDFQAALDRPRGATIFVGPPDGPKP